MQTTNALVANMPTANAGGKGMTASAALTTGTEAGFGKMLVQVMGGAVSGEQGTTALPDLGQLMALLFGANASAESTAPETGTVDPQVLALMLQQLSQQPEELEKLLGNEDMQGWLMQAAMLLQGMGQPVAVVNNEVTAMTNDNAAEAVQAASSLNAGQAQAVLQAFSKLLQEQPSNVFVAQLQEKLEGLLAAQTQVKDTKAAANTKDTVKKYADAQGTVQVSTVTSSPLSRLEILAAKSMTVQQADLISGQMEKEAGASAKGDDNSMMAAPAQETSRFTLVKEAAPVEATVRSQALAEDISKLMLGRMRIQSANGLTEARLTLTPEALGKVDVTLSMQNGQLVAHFAAQTSMGKDALEAQLAQLRATLQSQGIQVERMEVTQSPNLQSSMFQNQRGQQQSQQFNRQNEGRANEGGEEYAAEASAILNGRGQTDPSGFDVIA